MKRSQFLATMLATTLTLTVDAALSSSMMTRLLFGQTPERLGEQVSRVKENQKMDSADGHFGQTPFVSAGCQIGELEMYLKGQ